MSKTHKELEFKQHYIANVQQILDEVVVQLAQERRAAELAAAMTANVEQRIREKMQAAGLLAGNE